MKKHTLYTKRYLVKNYRRYGIDFNKNTESDIIKKLESVKSINGYLKQLIRADMQGDDND